MTDLKHQPIFYDPKQKRWPRIKYTMLVVVSLMFLLLVLFIVTIFWGAFSQKYPFPAMDNLYSGEYIKRMTTKGESGDYTLSGPRETKLNSLKIQKISTPLSQSYHPKRIAFLLDTPMGKSALIDQASNVDMVVGGWLHLDSADGDIREENIPNTLMEEVSEKNPAIKFIPMLDNNLNSPMLNQMLANPSARKRVVQFLVTYLKTNSFEGINIDLEELSAQNKQNIVLFMQELAAAFRPYQFYISMDVPAASEGIDYKKLVPTVDHLILMMYDEHWDRAKPGPVASLKWFSEKLKLRQQDIPAEKMIVGLGSYGYDWKEGTARAQDKSFLELTKLAAKYSAPIKLDPTSLNPTFKYKDAENKQHEVWFLDSVSAFNQFAVASTIRPHGFALWAMGIEDPSFWSIPMQFPLNAEAAQSLRIINYLHRLNVSGEGGILFASSQLPVEGERTVAFDHGSGLIFNEHYLRFPTTYQLYRFGGVNPKKIALTFDDGPDPEYTPQILNILKNMNVKATFFVIGSNVLTNPELVKREFAEGHDIGNHTFSHPDISKLSDSQVQLELFSTERLLATLIKRRTTLFRPPFGIDKDPDTLSEFEKILNLNKLEKLGYMTIATDVDSSDWEEPGVNKIVNNVLDQVRHHAGTIITMHDAGGFSREQTVEALPIIIATLKKSGYQFVTISELLGKPQTQTMPETTNSWQLHFDTWSFAVLAFGAQMITVLFLFGIGAGLFRLLFICWFAIKQKLKQKPFVYKETNFSVSVCIPAFNEAKVVVKAIHSILDARHPEHFEIIVINDGSTDNTLTVLQENFANHPLVKILNQANAGKAAALNYAINQTKNDIIITMDADTVCNADTIVNLLPPFLNEKTGVVAATIKVGNQVNILTRWQALEYVIMQNLDRYAFNALNAIPIAPGALSAWRRSAVCEAGGFTQDTLTEDTDLTLKVKKLGYMVAFSSDSVGYTEVPDTVSALLRQRYRWLFGTLQVMWKYMGTLFQPRYGSLGSIVIPNFILSMILQVIAPLMDLVCVLTLINLGVDSFFHPDIDVNGHLVIILVYYLVFTCADVLAALIAFCIEGKEKKSLLVWLIPQRFCYRQLIYYVVMRTLLSALQGRAVWWGKSQRKNTVNV